MHVCALCFRIRVQIFAFQICKCTLFGVVPTRGLLIFLLCIVNMQCAKSWQLDGVYWMHVRICNVLFSSCALYTRSEPGPPLAMLKNTPWMEDSQRDLTVTKRQLSVDAEKDDKRQLPAESNHAQLSNGAEKDDKRQPPAFSGHKKLLSASELLSDPPTLFAQQEGSRTHSMTGYPAVTNASHSRSGPSGEDLPGSKFAENFRSRTPRDFVLMVNGRPDTVVHTETKFLTPRLTPRGQQHSPREIHRLLPPQSTLTPRTTNSSHTPYISDNYNQYTPRGHMQSAHPRQNGASLYASPRGTERALGGGWSNYHREAVQDRNVDYVFA